MLVTDIRAGLHWWTAGIPEAEEDQIIRHMGRESWSRAESPGGLGHPYRRIHETGVVLYCGSAREDQPCVLNATGVVCESWADEVVNWTLQMGGYCTRADFAVDVGPSDMARSRLLQLRRDYRAGRCVTPMRRGSLEYVHSDGDTGGDTLYLGGKHAEVRLRCYDVRGPLRLEWQYRPEKRGSGRWVAELYRDHGPLTVWRSITKAKLMFRQDWYCHLAEGESVELVKERRTDDTSLAQMVVQVRQQFGTTLAAAKLLGVLDELMVDLDAKRLRGAQLAKLLQWSHDADVMGYDGSQLREKLR